MRKVVAIALPAVLLAGLCGCGPSVSTLEGVARQGHVDAGAPVSVQLETSIAAPPERVWALLTDAADWPHWHSQISQVEAEGVLTQGAHFTWKSGGTTIHSQVQLFAPARRLAWTGTAYTAKAVHVWELLPTPGGQTVVIERESMDGPLIAHMVSQQELMDADTAWLADLKKAAEK